MRTVAFYSFKGGTGKSLAAANMAVCLSRLGKHCAVVDLDFDCPTLHLKFENLCDHAPGAGGVVDFVRSHTKGDPWTGWNSVKLVSSRKAQKPLSDFTYPVPQRGADLGTIHLIAAGDYIHQEEYLASVASPVWTMLFASDVGLGVGAFTAKQASQCERFLESFKEQVSDLSPEPEYFLLDLRSGFGPLSRTTIRLWADVVAVFLASNVESVSILSGMLREMQAWFDGPLTYEAVVPVLTRTPMTLETGRGVEVKQTILSMLSLQEDELYYLHSDRDVEMFEHLRLGLSHMPHNCLLSHEYVRLFARLMLPAKEYAGQDVTEQVDEMARAIKSSIKLGQFVQWKDRVFRLETERGALINPSDNARNVSFKVETIKLLLHSLREELLTPAEAEQAQSGHDGTESGAAPTDEPTGFEQALRVAGAECGKRFGSVLINDVWRLKGPAKENHEDWVRKWSDFDSDVGFGRFAPKSGSLRVEGGRLTSCKIVLRESFLAPAHDSEYGDHALCSFISGYIEGVLSHILGGTYTVIHEILGYEDEQSRSESCVFKVAKKPTGTTET
ncbi:MAG TPA: division plane positioning ATPase MipZ [Phycisphaerae bacterium]|nr:division plane positioning ATPase MipZ [Phycisphaerae bacterium]